MGFGRGAGEGLGTEGLVSGVRGVMVLSVLAL